MDTSQDEVGLALLYHQNINNELMKMVEENYNIYVNGEYMGNKQLLNQDHGIEAVTDYLEQNGFPNLIAQIHGDNYLLHAEDNQVNKVKELVNKHLGITGV